MRKCLTLLMLFVLPLGTALASFDHEHRVWAELLKRHVVVKDGGRVSQVRYAALKADRPTLKAYLDGLSAVNKLEFDGWTKSQQVAFLINAYNGFTLEKILSRYPDIESIRDFGTIFGNPWKDKFFSLLGRDMNLDNIEHDTLRAQGSYEDPRIHFAVNCASIGCPMLREEPYLATRLDAQLDEQVARFLSDRRRNRYNSGSGRLEVSRIFDWYGKDFARGWKGYHSLAQFLADHAVRLADDAASQQRLTDRQADIDFLDYDWRLNDAGR